MMDWIRKHSYEINFFVAGWCALACLHDLANANYVWAAFNAGLVYLNIKFATE